VYGSPVKPRAGLGGITNTKPPAASMASATAIQSRSAPCALGGSPPRDDKKFAPPRIDQSRLGKDIK
jgi:hypothetical protein